MQTSGKLGPSSIIENLNLVAMWPCGPTGTALPMSAPEAAAAVSTALAFAVGLSVAVAAIIGMSASATTITTTTMTTTRARTWPAGARTTPTTTTTTTTTSAPTRKYQRATALQCSRQATYTTELAPCPHTRSSGHNAQEVIQRANEQHVSATNKQLG